MPCLMFNMRSTSFHNVDNGAADQLSIQLKPNNNNK